MDNVKRIWLDQGGQNPSQSRYSLVNDDEERPLQTGDSLESQTREEWSQIHSKNSSGSSRIRHNIHLATLYALIALLAAYAFTGRTASSSDILQQDLLTPEDSLADGSKAAKSNGLLPAGKRFAYAQYVTNRIYLCNALIMFKRLRHFGATAEFALTFPSNWQAFQVSDPNDDDRHIAFLLDQARDLGVHFHPYEPIRTEEANGFYLDVNNKFSVFNLTDYDRIIYMDSDALAYNQFDDLFSLPSTPLAIPRAYWYQESNYLTSAFMIIEPSAFLHQKVIDRLPGGPDHVQGHVLDMDVVNDLAEGWAMLLPHRGLFMLSNDLRDGEDDPGHQRYLRASQSGLKWDAAKEFSSVRLFHFSEKGPKQWEGHQRMDRFCEGRTDAGCEAWMQLLDDYLTSVDDVCSM